MRAGLISFIFSMAFAFPAAADMVAMPLVKTPDRCEHCYDILGVSSRTPCNKISLPAKYRKVDQKMTSISKGSVKSNTYLSSVTYMSEDGRALDKMQFTCTTPLTGNVVSDIRRSITYKLDAPSMGDTVSSVIQKYGRPSFSMDMRAGKVLAFYLDAKLAVKASDENLTESEANPPKASAAMKDDIGFLLGVGVGQCQDSQERACNFIIQLRDFALEDEESRLVDKFKEDLDKKPQAVEAAKPTEKKPAGGPVPDL